MGSAREYEDLYTRKNRFTLISMMNNMKLQKLARKPDPFWQPIN